MKKILLFSFLFFNSCPFVWAQSGLKHILLEEFSTAPCGFCPDGDLIAAQLIIDHPEVIWVTHHAGFGTDAMTIPESVTIANTFTTFAPGGCIDRGDYPIPVYTIAPFIAISRQKWDSVCVAHLNDPAIVDVYIHNDYDTVTRILNCTVTANFISAPAPGDLRLNLFLAEDSVMGIGNGYDQHSYFNTQVGHPYYGMGDTIIGYVHHHVMRDVVSPTWGLNGIIPASPVAGSSYTHLFSNISIPVAWKNKDMDVIAFVSYYNDSAKLRQVINSNHKPLLDDSWSDVSEILEEKNSTSIYPNPNSGNFFVELKSETATLEVFNLLGEKVFSTQLKNNLEEMKLNVRAGIYLCRISGSGFVENHRLVVQQ